MDDSASVMHIPRADPAAAMTRSRTRSFAKLRSSRCCARACRDPEARAAS
jgi:hypothetical protein